MTSHPNRSRRRRPAATPTPEQIRAARESAGLTQSQASALVHAGLRAWQKWEAGERRMHPAFWDLFRRRLAADEHVTG